MATKAVFILREAVDIKKDEWVYIDTFDTVDDMDDAYEELAAKNPDKHYYFYVDYVDDSG